MTTILLVAALVIAAGLAFWFMRKPSAPQGASARPAKSGSGAMTPELAELFELAKNPGSDGTPFMFALQTCRHCKKTREFLDENKISYHLLYVDSYEGEARSILMDKVRSYNPRGSFPTLVLPDGDVVIGFREHILREALLHDTGSAA